MVDWAAEGMVLNIKRFRLKPGVDEEAFLATDARLRRDFTLKQAGIRECLTARTTTGEWLVLHTWAVAEMGPSPTAGDDLYLRALTDEWMGHIDESTVTSTRFEPRR